jgi:hypothetical protein
MTRRRIAVGLVGVLVAATGTVIGFRVANTCAGVPTFVSGQSYDATGQTITLNCPVVLDHLTGVTINGGKWLDPNHSPGNTHGHGTARGRPAFDIIGGSDNTLSNLGIAGVNPGGYKASLAFNAGITLEGSAGTTISHVGVNHVFGDCLNLEPERRGTAIVAAVTGFMLDTFNATACGRQGIESASVNGAALSTVTVGSTGQDPFDFEADQKSKEGAKNVTITGATFSGLINISSGGEATGPITFSGLTQPSAASGDVLRVANSDSTPMAGPVTISDSTIRCGASVYVACLQLNRATVVMANDAIFIGFPHDQVKEAFYSALNHTILTFVNSTVSGIVGRGIVDSTSKVTNPPSKVITP